MVSDELIQAAIITQLKANTALVNALVAAGSSANEIRESDWQGTEFVYPNVRVDLGLQEPRENGTCRETKSDQVVTVQVYSEQPSSRQARVIAGLVSSALFGVRLSGSGFRTLSFNSRGVEPPVRTAPRVWRSDALFTTMVYQV